MSFNDTEITISGIQTTYGELRDMASETNDGYDFFKQAYGEFIAGVLDGMSQVVGGLIAEIERLSGDENEA